MLHCCVNMKLRLPLSQSDSDSQQPSSQYHLYLTIVASAILVAMGRQSVQLQAPLLLHCRKSPQFFKDESIAYSELILIR